MARAPSEHELLMGSSADAIALIAATLENVVQQNQDLRQSQPTSFDAVSAPSITVHRYLSRIRQYTKFQDECYVVALVYLDRLFQNHKAPFLPTAHNVHRLIITSVLLASKFYDDVFHSNSFMAQVGGISVAEINKLEIELCLRLNWELHIVHDEYLNMVESLLQPQRPLWRRWQHQHSLSFSSDDEAAAPEPTASSHALGGMQQAARSLLPKWAGGFPRAPGGASDAAQPPADALRRQASDPTSGRGDSGASPATSVSVH